MKRFKSPRQVLRFLSIHDLIANLFHLRSDSRPASDYRAARAQAFTAWVEVAGALRHRSLAICGRTAPATTDGTNELAVT